MATLSSQSRHHAGPNHIAVLADNLCNSVDAPMSPHPDGYRADVERILALVLAGLELGLASEHGALQRRRRGILVGRDAALEQIGHGDGR